MGIEINISGAVIKDEAKVLNRVTFRNADDIHIDLHNLEVSGKVSLLEDLEIDSVLNDLKNRAQNMDKRLPEYSKVQEILTVNNWDRNELLKRIARHLGEFSQGVLASIVANYLM